MSHRDCGNEKQQKTFPMIFHGGNKVENIYCSPDFEVELIESTVKFHSRLKRAEPIKQSKEFSVGTKQAVGSKKICDNIFIDEKFIGTTVHRMEEKCWM
jgi:hypothetical protein